MHNIDHIFIFTSSIENDCLHSYKIVSSVCAVYRCQIIGLIVAEIKETGNLPKEDSEILGPDNICPSLFGKSNRRNSNQRLGYILSLGKMIRNLTFIMIGIN